MRNLRIGSRVRVVGMLSGRRGQEGHICPMPGGRGRNRNGTAGFKFVRFGNGEVEGMFTCELDRVHVPERQRAVLQNLMGE